MRQKLAQTLITLTVAAAATYCGDDSGASELPQFSAHDPLCEDVGCEDIFTGTSTQPLNGELMLRVEVRIPASTPDGVGKTVILMAPVEQAAPHLLEKEDLEVQ